MTGDGQEHGGHGSVDRYHENIARALLSYVEDRRGRRLRGVRNGDQLVLTIVIEDPDHFHSHLNRFNEQSL